MYKVTLKDVMTYNEVSFIFPDMVEAAGFMSSAFRHTTSELAIAVTQVTPEEDEIPGEFEELE